VLRELAVANRLYCFFATAGRLDEAGVVSQEDATRWSDGLRAAAGEGRFFSLYTAFLVRVIRPGVVGPGV
jgi:hypothetical protein